MSETLHEISEEQLLAVPINESEMATLLDRLAATEALSPNSQSTIRDVAELTDISPKIIARILGDIRGDTELQKLQGQLSDHSVRLLSVEQRLGVSMPKQVTSHPIARQKPVRRSKTTDLVVGLVAGVAFIFFLLMIVNAIQTRSSAGTKVAFTKYGQLVKYRDGRIFKQEGPDETPATPEEAAEFERVWMNAEANRQAAGISSP